jgi:hypothetical protein
MNASIDKTTRARKILEKALRSEKKNHDFCDQNLLFQGNFFGMIQKPSISHVKDPSYQRLRYPKCRTANYKLFLETYSD